MLFFLLLSSIALNLLEDYLFGAIIAPASLPNRLTDTIPDALMSAFGSAVYAFTSATPMTVQYMQETMRPHLG